MPAEISMPVHIRVGTNEARWGELTVEVHDGTISEQDTRQALAAFLRASADHLDSPSDQEVPDAASHG